MEEVEALKVLAKNISVLYVEDEQAARKSTSKILSRIFDTVDIAKNGIEGLFLFMQSKHDLIISDIVMGNMDGLEMARLIKNVEEEQSIIFLSAYTDQKFLTKAIELGVDAFVFKPINTDMFYTTLDKTLKHIILKKENIAYKKSLEKLVEDRTLDLSIKNKELQEMIIEVKKANRLKEEMLLAQKVQENFLPKKLPSSKKMSVATYFEAAQYVGGDYYDLFNSSEDYINIIIADVSGHGVAPAITMSTFRGVCRSVLTLPLDFDKQISIINNLMCEDSKYSEFFITAFFMRYYEKENRLEYISTGHNDILYYNNKKDEIESLKSTSIPLGIFEDKKYEFVKKEINKDDILVLYTDGLTESKNTKKEMFKLDRLISILNESKDLDAKKILKNIKNSLNDFIQDEPKDDDTTILITKFS